MRSTTSPHVGSSVTSWLPLAHALPDGFDVAAAALHDGVTMHPRQQRVQVRQASIPQELADERPAGARRRRRDLRSWREPGAVMLAQEPVQATPIGGQWITGAQYARSLIDKRRHRNVGWKLSSARIHASVSQCTSEIGARARAPAIRLWELNRKGALAMKKSRQGSGAQQTMGHGSEKTGILPANPDQKPLMTDGQVGSRRRIWPRSTPWVAAWLRRQQKR